MRFVFAAVCSRRSALSLVGLAILELWSAEQSMESVAENQAVWSSLLATFWGSGWQVIQHPSEMHTMMALTPLPLERWWLVSLDSQTAELQYVGGKSLLDRIQDLDSTAAKSNGCAHWPTFSACPAKWGLSSASFQRTSCTGAAAVKIAPENQFHVISKPPGSCWSWPENLAQCFTSTGWFPDR